MFDVKAADADLITVKNATYSGGVISTSVSAKNYYVTVSPGTKTVTITAANEGQEVKITGNILATATVAAGTITVNGQDKSATVGTTEIPVEATVTKTSGLTIKLSTANQKDAKLSISFTPTLQAVTNIPVKFLPSDDGESYKAGDSTITAETDIGVNDGTGINITAAPTNGKSCIGLIDTATNKLVCGINSEGTGTFIPEAACTVKPYYITTPSKQPFRVNGKYYYSWESAFLAAGIQYPVILNDNYTLPTTYADNYLPSVGNYVTGSDGNLEYNIPKGATFLVPYNSSGTVCTAKPTVTSDAWVEPSAFLTLTMASGSHIAVNGSLSVSGTLTCAIVKKTNSTPTGPLGYIDMSSNSSITVKSEGNLFAWGYIYGSGKVIVEGNGTVYENFQLADYRAGDATNQMTKGDNTTTYHVFPFSQYYVQNVQVPMQLNAGAMENAFFAVYVSRQTLETTVSFIGASGMFQITDGYIVKDYIESDDRLHIKVQGNFEINPTNIVIKSPVPLLVQDTTIYSSNYYLPIHSGFTIDIESGTTTVKQDLALLPGAVLKIAEGAKCVVADNKSIVVYDLDDWAKNATAAGGSFAGIGFCYHEANGYKNYQMVPVYYAVGRQKTRNESELADAKLCVNGTLDVSNGYLYTTSGKSDIYSTTNGKVVTRTGTLGQSYQVWQYDTTLSYQSIPVTPAQLKNEYFDEANNLPIHTPTADVPGTYNYNPEHGRWDAADGSGVSHRITADDTVPPTCDSAGYTTYTCSCGYQYHADYTAPHSNTDCEHKADALFDIYGTSVQAGDSLNMFFYVEAEHLSGTDYKAMIQRGQPDGTVKSETIPFADWTPYTVDGKSLYRFVYKGIAAKEMSEQVFVTICEEDGTILSNPYSDSIEQYALDLLKATDNANLRTTLVDMLNYGAACQTHFSYNTTHLANARLTEEQKGYATSSVPICDAVTSGDEGYKNYFVEHSVSVENSLVYTFVFKDIDESVAPVVTYTDHYGRERTLENLSFKPDGDYHLVDVTGLAIADGCPDGEKEITISCTVTTSAGTQITVNGSIEAYANSAMNAYPNDPVFGMLMCFASSAYMYFHNLPVNA